MTNTNKFITKVRSILFVKLIYILLFIPVQGYSNENATYIFGVFPHVPTSKLFEMYKPVSTDFENSLRQTVLVRTKASYSEFESALEAEIYDIALIQPFNYPDAHDKYNYLPVARRSDQLSAVLIVKKNSQVTTLSDLKGKKIASTAKTAAVSRLIDRVIIKNGLSPSQDFIRLYKKNHFSCIQAVLIGLADACSTSNRALNHYYQVKLRDKFRIILESEKIPHVLYIVHKRVPLPHRNLLKNTILNWQNTESGKKILAKSQMSFFIEAKDEEYDVLR